MEGRGEEEILRVSPAVLLRLVAVALLLTSCITSTDLGATPSPAKTADIRRTRLDIAYSAFVDLDVHKPTSKAALQGAIDALRREAKATSGKDDFPTLDLQDSTETQLDDFKKFADAVSAFALRNPQL